MFIKKGTKVKYLMKTPYYLGNGQQFKNFQEGEINSDVNVRDGFFKVLVDLDALHEEALKENKKIDEENAKKAREAEVAKKLEEAKANKTKK